MDTFTSAEVGKMVFTLGSAMIISLLWFGYYRNVFVGWLSFTILGSLIGYVVVFILYRYLTHHIEHHIAREANYALIASIHGSISLLALLLTFYIFFKSRGAFQKGRNYFTEKKYLTLSLALLWPLTLISGLLF